MTIKQLVLFFSLMTITPMAFSQIEEPVTNEKQEKNEKIPLRQRLVFGGDIGLSFGSITYIKLAPVVGYRLTDRLTAGLGPIYIYEKYKNYGLESSTYGGKGLVSFIIIKGAENGGSLGIGDILLHAENEVISVEPWKLVQNGQFAYYIFGDRVWIDNLLIGGGISQPISGRFRVSILMLFDVTQNKYSPYTNPIFKFGFNF